MLHSDTWQRLHLKQAWYREYCRPVQDYFPYFVLNVHWWCYSTLLPVEKWLCGRLSTDLFSPTTWHGVDMGFHKAIKDVTLLDRWTPWVQPTASYVLCGWPALIKLLRDPSPPDHVPRCLRRRNLINRTEWCHVMKAGPRGVTPGQTGGQPTVPRGVQGHMEVQTAPKPRGKRAILGWGIITMNSLRSQRWENSRLWYKCIVYGYRAELWLS